jgi:hypothetical protein
MARRWQAASPWRRACAPGHGLGHLIRMLGPRGERCHGKPRVQGDSGATPNPTVNRRHHMTALLNADRSVPAGMA